MRLLMLLAVFVPGGAYMLPVALMRRHMEVRPEIAEEVPVWRMDDVQEVALDVCPPREPRWIFPPQCHENQTTTTSVLSEDHLEDEHRQACHLEDGGSRLAIDGITIFDYLDKAVVCALLLVLVSFFAARMLRRRTDAPEILTSDIEGLVLTEFFREREILIRINKERQISEEMRAFLVNWAIEVHVALNLKQETLYLTVYVIDKYLESEEAAPQDLLLVGVTAILLASKYEETDPPKISVLAISTNRRYTKEDIIEMESKMAKAIQYRLTVPTIYSFLLRYHQAEYADDKIVQLSCFVAERMLQEVSMLDYLPSVIACSAIYIARKNTGRTCWSPTLEEHTKYHEEDLIPCLTEMSRILKAEGDLDAVKKKFSSSRFGSVATMEIAVLPDDLP